MFFRSLNILGLDTIAILTMLTSKVKEVFTHSTMVERVAAMLNYFLKTLVGPDRKSFKVWAEKFIPDLSEELFFDIFWIVPST